MHRHLMCHHRPFWMKGTPAEGVTRQTLGNLVFLSPSPRRAPRMGTLGVNASVTWCHMLFSFGSISSPPPSCQAGHRTKLFMLALPSRVVDGKGAVTNVY